MCSMNFLFWNIQRNKKHFNLIKDLLYTKDIDILMLAEFPDECINLFLDIINQPPKIYTYEYVTPYMIYNKVKIFTRFSASLLLPCYDKSQLSARQLFSPYLNKYITIITCHLPSKINKSDANLSGFSEDIANYVYEVEKKTEHKRTIICGDFNMNPFDEGIIKAKGLHAVMDKSIALKKSSTVHEKEYPFFYNPMWGFLGDTGRGNASGTLYYNSSDHINYYWHIYDQVLIRPELINYFDCNQIQIITVIGNKSLIRNGIINKQYSDHLPIKFNLKL